MAANAVIPNEGKLRLLACLTGGVGTADWRIMLIKADFTLSESLEYLDLSFADFSGYAAATPSFGAPAIVGGKAKAVDAQRTFLHNGGATPNTIYGHALVDTDVNKLLKVQKESTSVTMAAVNDSYKVTEALTFDNDG